MYSDKHEQHNETASGFSVNYLGRGIKFDGRRVWSMPVVDYLYQAVCFCLLAFCMS